MGLSLLLFVERKAKLCYYYKTISLIVLLVVGVDFDDDVVEVCCPQFIKFFIMKNNEKKIFWGFIVIKRGINTPPPDFKPQP
jgi:hypothetical protein